MLGSQTTRVLLEVVAGAATAAEVGRRMGLSRGAVHYHLRLLEAAGLVQVNRPRKGALRANVRPVPWGPGRG